MRLYILHLDLINKYIIKVFYLNLFNFTTFRWLNLIREGLLVDQFFKLFIGNFILYWITFGSMLLNFTFINRLVSLFYFKNIFLVSYDYLIELSQYSLTITLWKLGLIFYYFLIIVLGYYFLLV